MVSKVKSPIVYREIRRVFQPWCRQEGFRRTKSTIAAWYREHDRAVRKHGFLCFWFQVSAWDNSLTAEFQLSHEPKMSHYGRQRIGWVLTPEQRQLVLTREAESRRRTPTLSSPRLDRLGDATVTLSAE